ncbi:MAG: helix-turn-helix domain-containing protein [Thermoleophilia bacterium]|nr:helix-turn-helix domain-containing protein [Thermoleophilia bacterium]
MKPNAEEIVNQVGVEKVVEMMRDVLDPALFDECERLGVDAEAIIRYMPLADRFKEGRARLNLTIKEVAAQLKEPQYKIKAVEKGEIGQIDTHVFQKYCRFLELDEYLASWCLLNSELAKKLDAGGEAQSADANQIK